MKLWILRPQEKLQDNPWEPWYNKSFGFIVRAETETDARNMAHENGGEENLEEWENETRTPWKDAAYSTCTELMPAGKAGVVMNDFSRA